MRRALVPVSVAAVVLLGLVAYGAGGLRTAAQDEAAAMAAHPLVGAWRFDDPADPANVGFAAYHPDGTLTMLSGDVGAGIGVWRPTGDRTAEATNVHLDIDPDRNVNAPGTVTGVSSIEVDASGDALTASATVHVRAPDGTVVFEFALTATATRMEVEPVVPLGTPEADPDFLTALAGTPAP